MPANCCRSVTKERISLSISRHGFTSALEMTRIISLHLTPFSNLFFFLLLFTFSPYFFFVAFISSVSLYILFILHSSWLSLKVKKKKQQLSQPFFVFFNYFLFSSLFLEILNLNFLLFIIIFLIFLFPQRCPSLTLSDQFPLVS